MVPVDSLVVQANDDYVAERHRCRRARDSDFVLVNLFGEPVGEAMAPGAINELLQRLSCRAELDRPVHPHMLRHGFGSSVMEAGGRWTRPNGCWVAAISSTQVYLHPSEERLRAAVERVNIGLPARGGSVTSAARALPGSGPAQDRAARLMALVDPRFLDEVGWDPDTADPMNDYGLAPIPQSHTRIVPHPAPASPARRGATAAGDVNEYRTIGNGSCCQQSATCTGSGRFWGTDEQSEANGMERGVDDAGRW